MNPVGFDREKKADDADTRRWLNAVSNVSMRRQSVD